jgi:hypothetical protein
MVDLIGALHTILDQREADQSQVTTANQQAREERERKKREADLAEEQYRDRYQTTKVGILTKVGSLQRDERGRQIVETLRIRREANCLFGMQFTGTHHKYDGDMGHFDVEEPSYNLELVIFYNVEGRMWEIRTERVDVAYRYNQNGDTIASPSYQRTVIALPAEIFGHAIEQLEDDNVFLEALFNIIDNKVAKPIPGGREMNWGQYQRTDAN